MKCINCNKEIPDSSVVCPYCNGKVDPVVTATPEFNLESNNEVINTVSSEETKTNEQVTPVNVTLPVTPTEPQLPSDQNNLMVDTAVQPVISSEQVEVMSSSEQTVEDIQEPVTSVQPETVNYSEPTKPAEEEKVKIADLSKKIKISKKVIIIIVAILVVLCAAGGVLYYLTVYKSADKRLQEFTNKMFEAPLFSSISGLSNKDIELSSGEYEFGLELNFDETSLLGTLYGKYGISTKDKITDITMNLKNVSVSGTQLINEKNPLSIEIALNEDRAYVLLQNFFDKYIYTQSPEIGNIYDVIEQNDFDYTYTIDTLKNAFVKALKSLDSKQSVGTETINGKSIKANIVSIDFNKKNITTLVETIISEIKSDKKFISQISKLLSVEESKVASTLNELKVGDNVKDTGVTFKLLTSNFGGEFYGAIFTNNSDSVEITLDNNVYKVAYSCDKAKIFDFSVSEELVKEAAKNTRSGLIDLTMFMNDTAYSSKITYKLVEDVNPKVEKINTKNSINFENISSTDFEQIVNKIYNFGVFGQVIKESFGDSLTALMYASSPEMQLAMMCSQATSCTNNYNGTATCVVCGDTTCTQNMTITCPLQ